MAEQISVLIKPEDSNTNVGIGTYSHNTRDPFYIIVPLCPACSGRLIYMANTGPTMVCQFGPCRKMFSEFRGIPSSLLGHSSDWKQSYTYRPDLRESYRFLIEFIDRWTNLVVHIEQT